MAAISSQFVGATQQSGPHAGPHDLLGSPGSAVSVTGLSRLSTRSCSAPRGMTSTSPTPSAIGSPFGGTTQHDPCKTTWNPAPGTTGYRRPHGACRMNRPEVGLPVRMAAIASLRMSTKSPYTPYVSVIDIK